MGREAIRAALAMRGEAVGAVVEAAQLALARTPPELLTVVRSTGLWLTGAEGLPGLDQVLREATGLTVHPDDEGS